MLFPFAGEQQFPLMGTPTRLCLRALLFYRLLCGFKIKLYRAVARENMYNRECQIRMAWLLWKHKSEARLVIAIEKQNTGYITFTGVLELLRIVFNWLNTLRCSQDYMRNSV